MNVEPIDLVPLWVLPFVIGLFAFGALEAGFRFGRWRHAHAPGENDAPVGAMVGAVLGLLAFMLAFTFSLGASRFDSRRQALLMEANAVSTTALRARLLSEPERTAVRRLLEEYVELRVHGVTKEKILDTITGSEDIHRQLWTQAVSCAAKTPTPITALFINSLNEVIDLHAERIHFGLRSRIPVIIWAGLFGLALLGMASIGFQSGLLSSRRSPEMAVLVFAFAGVMYLIADLDRPVEGFIRVNQQPMIDVQHSLQESSLSEPSNQEAMP